jgi:multidrug resistance efflux pump
MPQPATPAQPDLHLNDREQIQYLLGNPPSWMMRYGIMVMAGFFLLLLALSYFIRYPDIIEAKVYLVTAHPPIRILAKSSGPVSELLVTDKQEVKAGQVLAVIENTANWRDIARLESWLATADSNSEALPSDLHLGALQTAYSGFSQHWKDYQYFTAHNGVAAKIEHLQKQIGQTRALNANLEKQKAIQHEDFILAGKEIGRQRQLHYNQVIADREMENSERNYLQQKRQIENLEASTLQNQMQIRQLESQINDLLQTKSDNAVDKSLTLDEDLRRLNSAIGEWKQNYLVVAPIHGKVSFSKVWSVQQSVTAGEEIMAVVPDAQNAEGNPEIVGKATLPAVNAGKIRTGMRAIIRLEGLPAQEYGTLEALVSNIALLPQKEEYLLDLNLTDPLLKTSYGKKVPFRQEMAGNVRIVTEERRVVERIFERLKALFW